MMKRVCYSISFILVFFSCNFIWTNELILSEDAALSLGFKPVKERWLFVKTENSFDLPYAKYSLTWPVKLKNDLNSIGNLMSQFQSYWGAYVNYFHGGCDLVVYPHEEIVAPIEGKVEAGYYAYTLVGDGYSKKLWIPLFESDGKQVHENYFEVAIIDKYGYRFEFHHVDRKSLSIKLLSKIKNGESVKAGTVLGKVRPWSAFMNGHPYDHVHYNILSPSGVKVNCEWVAKPLLDKTSPTIQTVYALTDTETFTIHNGDQLQKQPNELVIDTFDQKDNNPFIHQPHYIEFKVESGRKFIWDFRKALLDKTGARPKIFDFFMPKVVLSNQKVVRTLGNYNEFRFLIRIPILSSDRGRFSITVKDSMGNSSEFFGYLQGIKV